MATPTGLEPATRRLEGGFCSLLYILFIYDF
jgi:hypothetical protein